MEKTRKGRAIKVIIVLAVLLLVVFVVSFMFGRYPVSPGELFGIIFGDILGIEPFWSGTMETVLYNIRLPRILIACLVGAALSVSGATYQGVFQNPLASPDLLGASTGAAFGASLAIVLNRSSFEVTACAFLFSLLSITVVFLVSKKAKGSRIMTFVLAGIMISALFNAGVSFIKLVADPYSHLPSITYWLMGSLNGTTMSDFAFLLIPTVIGMVPLFLIRWRLNILTMGDDEARTMGVNAERLRIIAVLCSTLLTAASVAVGGMIGFIGLMAPHLVRRLVGNNFKYLIPASALAGALFLLIVDDLSRNLFATELPIGILTSFLGVPFFVYLLLKRADFAE